MANRKINELVTRTPSLTDLILVGDPSSGYSYKATVTALATIIETDIADGFVTLSTTQTISGAKTFSNNLTLTSVANAATTQTKFLTLNGSNVVNYRTGAEVLADIGGQGTISLAAIGSTPNANGATLSSNTLTLQPASASFGGVLTTGFQEIAGWKRFTGNPIQFDNHLEIKNLNSWGVSWGYTSFASKNTPVFGFLRGHNSAGSITYNAWFTYGTTGDRNYTLPSTDGTLALTSDITGSISGTTNYIPKFTSSSAIGNSVIYESSSNIGIGTITPAAKLDVVGSSGIRVNEDGAGTKVITIRSNYAGVDPAINVVTDNSLLFMTNNTERMRLTSTGLGIGTSSPQSILHLETSSGNGSAIRMVSTSANGRSYAIGSNFVTGVGEFSIYDYTAGASRFWISSTGNVGISTTSPALKLDVVSASQWDGIRVYNATASQGADIRVGNDVNNNLGFLRVGGSTSGGNNQNTLMVGTGGGYDIHIAPNGTPAITAKNGGNVGIGIASPSALLHLGSSGSAAQLWLQRTDGYNPVKLIGGTLSDGSGFKITMNTTDAFAITSGGNVGINSTSPSLWLTVNGTSGLPATSGTTQNGSIRMTSGGDYAMDMGVDNSSGKSWIQVGNKANLSGSFANPLLLNPNGGNVLIGTTTDAGYKLDVSGTGRFTSNLTIQGNDLDLNNGTVLHRITNDNTNLLIRADYGNASANSTIQFSIDGTERMRITGGDVVIGKTSVSYSTVGIAFEALGTISATRSSDFSAVFNRNTTDGGVVQFRKDNVAVGSISVTGSATAYNTSSDYRLKQDLKNFNGLNLVDSIKVYDYQWKADSTRSYGVMAHELQSVLPYAVTGIKDGENMQAVDYSKIVPILIKAIQEQQIEIENLKNK